MKKQNVFILIILIVGVGAYYAGRQSMPAVQPQPQVTPQADNTVPVSQGLTWDELVARHPNELSDPANRTVYTCDGGKTFLARVEIKPMGGGKAEVFLKDGTKLVLPQTMSGSGVRYANKGELFVFWTKGNTAFIEEGPVTIYANCVGQK
jgi:membrane-bound inhibitor of C-type lysozyme